MQSALTQVPVYEEPRHRIALQNEYVRLIDVNILPHDTSQYHHHATPSAIVFLSKSITGSQPMGGEKNTGGKVSPGYSVYADFASKPVTHRVWNEGDSVYHVMDIEIFPRKNLVSCDKINSADCQLAWEQKNVRVYNIHIAPGKTFTVGKSACPHLLILISGDIETNPEQEQIEAGEFLWYKEGSKFKIKNPARTDTECVLLELI
ncbi:MAG: hypothetical protein JST75_00725 [Bacteroidetes bacterium]|nr:hypothetical protein [Bacteroidota bacterium]